MRLILELIFVAAAVFSQLNCLTLRHKREATSEGAINAAVLQGNNSNGTGDLFTNVDENDNAVLEANAEVATSNQGTSEVVNVVVGDVTDKNGTDFDLEAGTSVLAEANKVSEVNSNTSISSTSKGQSGMVTSSGVAQGIGNSAVFQRFFSKISKNKNLIKSLVTTSGSARGQYSVSSGHGRVDTDGKRQNTVGISGAAAIDTNDTEVESQVNVEEHDKNLKARGYVLSQQTGEEHQNSGSFGESETSAVSSDTTGQLGAEASAAGAATNAQSGGTVMANELTAGVDDTEGSIGLFGASSGAAGTGGNASIESASNVTATQTKLGADAVLGGVVQGQNQNLSLVSGIDAKEGNKHTIILGSASTGARGTDNTNVASAISSKYDGNGNSKLDVVTSGESKDKTGLGSGLDIYTSGALEQATNNISNKAEAMAMSNATGDTSEIKGDSFIKLTEETGVIAGIGAEAKSQGLNGSSTATEVRLKINDEEEMVAGGHIAISGTASQTESISRLERIGNMLNRMNRHRARIFGATNAFSINIASSTQAEPKLARKKRNAKTSFSFRYMCFNGRCYWLKQITDQSTGEVSYEVVTLRDLLQSFSLGAGSAEWLFSKDTERSEENENEKLFENENSLQDTLVYTKETENGGHVTGMMSHRTSRTNSGTRLEGSSYVRSVSN